MCEVCCASKALDSQGPVEFRWSDAGEGLGLLVQARGERAEFSPAQYRLKRASDADDLWSEWFHTEDLAGTMMRLGLSVKWRFVRDEVRQWLDQGPFGPVRELLAGCADAQEAQ